MPPVTCPSTSLYGTRGITRGHAGRSGVARHRDAGRSGSFIIATGPGLERASVAGCSTVVVRGDLVRDFTVEPPHPVTAKAVETVNAMRAPRCINWSYDRNRRQVRAVRT